MSITNRKAFSLMEMSIVIMIIALLFGGGMVIATTTVEKNKQDRTNTNLNTIQDALAIFLAMNGRLPCPAAPAQTLDSNSFGVEQTTGANPLACNTATGIFSGTNGATGMIQYYGAVPIRTLGLPDTTMFDGWGNRIGYVVQQAFVNNGSNSYGVAVTNSSCVAQGTSAQNSANTQYLCYRGQASASVALPAGGLTIADANNNTVSTDAVYILISHGSNGYGAYISDSGSGSALRNGLPPNTNPLEWENLNCNPTTFSCSSTGVNNVFVQAPPTKTFDDIVRFKTRNNLVINCNQYGANACFTRHGLTVQ